MFSSVVDVIKRPELSSLLISTRSCLNRFYQKFLFMRGVFCQENADNKSSEEYFLSDFALVDMSDLRFEV